MIDLQQNDEYINSLEEELLEVRGFLATFIEAYQMSEGVLKRARIRGVFNNFKEYMEGKETIENRVF